MVLYNKTKHKGTLILTAFSQQYLTRYAHRFLDSYDHLVDVDLVIASEDIAHIPTMRLDKDFEMGNAHRPKPRSYKHDAIRFHWKPQAVYKLSHSHISKAYDSILWIDADTQFKKPIDQQWIDTHIRTDKIMTYYGRWNYYPETGILFFNLEHEHTQRYIDGVWDYYTSGKIWDMAEQHDSYIWDFHRQRCEFDYKWQFEDKGITSHKVPSGHIIQYQLGEWLDHMKGPRKDKGYSPETHKNQITEYMTK